MKYATPYLRFIHVSHRFFNNQPTMAYDCRLLYILSGTGVLHTEAGDLPLQPDTLAYYPSGIRYLPCADSDHMEYVTVNFDFTASFNQVSEVQFPVTPEHFLPNCQMKTQTAIQEPDFLNPFMIPNAVFLRQPLLRMCELYRKDIPYREELCSALLKVCLLDILHHRANRSPENPLVGEIQEYIERNYQTISCNQDISSQFRYHSYYLNQLFCRHTGKTLHHYPTEVRLRHSQELLCHTDLSVAAIASTCGFHNPDHFSRLFREKCGMRASAYRKQFRNI